MSEVSVIIEKSDYNDTWNFAEMHVSLFPRSDFLAGMGKEFLHDLYDGLIDSPHCFAFSLFNKKRLLSGYIIGTTNLSLAMRQLSFWRKFKILANALGVFMRKPGKVIEYINIMRLDLKLDAELLIIAVDPSLQNRGLGRRLLKKLEQVYKLKGIRSYGVIVNKKNIVANFFYHSCGFSKIKDFNLNKKKMVLWKKYLVS